MKQKATIVTIATVFIIKITTTTTTIRAIFYQSITKLLLM
jgi:hypothetical protein